MFYKHWKKFALALTGFFLASCDTVTADEPLYGCPSDGCDQGPIDDSSSSTDGAATSSSEQEQISSSSRDFEVMPLYGVSEKFIVLSSSSEESSSSLEVIAPAYGVFKGVCSESSAGQKDDGSTVYKCDDGVTCVEKDSITGYGGLPCSPMETEEGLVEICPDYGVVAITEKTYTCDDGNTYNEAEFLSRYGKINILRPSSSSRELVQNDTLDAPIAVYGPPCMFSGTCDEEEK